MPNPGERVNVFQRENVRLSLCVAHQADAFAPACAPKCSSDLRKLTRDETQRRVAPAAKNLRFTMNLLTDSPMAPEARQVEFPA
jgi:hypothetical protein